MSRKNLKQNNDALINEARNMLINSYIPPRKHKGRIICGWRNGFITGNGVLPGPTATALGLEFLCRLGEFPSKISCRRIVLSLLNTQLEDPSNPGKKTGWEVMSMKQNNTQAVPSIDATATVIRVLRYVIVKQQFDIPMKTRIEASIDAGQTWLIEQAELDCWGVHKDDAHRVFVMCNILHALDPLGLSIDSVRHKITNSLISFQKNDGGWSATPNSAALSEIFHTAKVLNYLESLHVKDNEVECAISKGVGFLKTRMQHVTSSCYTIEDVLACNGATKYFYHDHYSEWLRHICHSTKWNSKDFYTILKYFYSVHYIDNGKFYTTVDGNNHNKDQVWLLIPTAIQCISCREYMINHPPAIINISKPKILCSMLLAILVLFLLGISGKYDLMGIAIIPFIINLVASHVYNKYKEKK